MTCPRFRALLLAIALLLSFAGAVPPLAAQDRPPAPDAAVETARAELDRIEGRLKDQSVDDQDLAALRDRLDPLSLSVQGAIAQLTPQLEAADQRLAQIGPKPPEGAPPESADVARSRDEQTATRQKVDETLKRARLLVIEASQVGEEITQRRRALLAQRLFERSRSIIDPGLWADVVGEAPRDFDSMRALGADWMGVVSRNSGPGSIGLVAASALLGLLLLFPGRRWVTHFGERLVEKQAPKSNLKRSATALLRLIATTLAPLLAVLCVYLGLKAAGWMPSALQRFGVALVWAAGLIGFAHGMLRALLAPGRPAWRLVDLPEETIEKIKNRPHWAMLTFVAGRLVAHFNEAVNASLSATIAASGVFAAANVVAYAIGLRRIRSRRPADQQAGKDERSGFNFFALARAAAWCAIAVVIAADVAGYVALAQFLANQMIWITAVIALAYILVLFANDLLSAGLSAETSFGRSAAGAIGIRPESLEQIGVVLSGVVRVLLIAVAVLVVLAPWGLQSADVFGWLRYAVTGIQVGGINFSLAGVLGTVLLVAIGFTLTRGVQRWLDRDLLPKTRMDVGLRASVSTAVGYFGAVVVIVLALGHLGLSLDRIAIVAGALSVGIGFGLQAIISNFVSGLILLAERPIKAGDWIVIGSDQGNVRRISVRSTEIELFDRATLIVPNSDFITKSVKNVTHGNPIGRVQIELSVSAAIDPAEIKRIALETAKSHPSVLDFPEPQLFFNALGDATNVFALFCNVPSPRQAASVKSDLNFALVKAFAEAGVALGGPAAPTVVDAADRLGEALSRFGLSASRGGEGEPVSPGSHDASDAPFVRGPADQPQARPAATKR